MRKTTLIVTITVLAMSLLGCKKEADTPPVPKNPFIGKWTVDYDRTMEETKKSPKYKPEVDQLFGMLIKNMVEKMKLEITSATMIYSKDQQEQVVAYTITSTGADGKTLTATSPAGEEEVQITFTLVDGDYMNFKSTGSDDMDYYIWKRTAESEG